MHDNVVRAAVALTLAGTLLGCQSSAPRGRSTSIAFTLERNVVRVEGVVDGAPASLIVATGLPETLLTPQLAKSRSSVTLGERYTVRIRPTAAPEIAPVADGLLGIDAFSNSVLTVDYHRGLLLLGRDVPPVRDAPRFAFNRIPAVDVTVDGQGRRAIIDTSNPDTLVLPMGPRGVEGRRPVKLTVAGIDFGSVDAAVGPVDAVRIGNRILSRFLVTIDFERREVSLWSDPR